ncbi:unnamed protein product [Schistocephalus solidus]|uniref:Secreted protein n=1 Tax=Schistocephalus solidus TaxID=70667 RepID=A0A183T050_SCHSO|nr:unnamed protein product [Schistocephalus solidus]
MLMPYMFLLKCLQVYFWLLHAQATITCPAQQPTPSAEEFQITFEQWLDSSAPGSKSVETEEAYDRGDSFYLPDHYAESRTPEMWSAQVVDAAGDAPDRAATAESDPTEWECHK